tara:strand:- start:116 stop:3184 length:3069 start_codon:yes stop_codon:yes gene_type:complete
VVVFSLAFGLPVVAQTLDTGIEYGTATGLGTQDIRITIMNIVRVILGFVGILALVIILYGGYTWMTAGGNAEQIDKAKKILVNAAIGLAIIFSAFAIVSFIISALEGTGGGGVVISGPPPPGPCDNCGYLGTGVIQAVYPEPFALDVARNTNIIVTFKELMDPSSIIDGAPATCTVQAPCQGILAETGTISPEPNVRIYEDPDEPTRLDADQVLVTSVDGLTFVFNPVEYLGDPGASGLNSTWYSVKLSNDIEKANQESAFPGAGGFFRWTFEIGFELDLDPPEVSNVFPQPDNSSDSYATQPAAQASGSIFVTELPNFAQTASTLPREHGICVGGDAAGDPCVNDARCTGGGTCDLDLQPVLTVSGNYSCLEDAWICISREGGTEFSINARSLDATTCSDGDPVDVLGLSDTAELDGQSLNIGCSLTLFWDDTTVQGQLWRFQTTAEKSASTLTVGGDTYTFVETAGGANTIVVNPAVDTLESISDKIVAQDNGLVTFADGDTDGEVELEAIVAGAAGNSIQVNASGDWMSIPNPAMTGGSEPTFTPTMAGGAFDVARNAILSLDFNEPIDPTNLVGNIIVQYHNDPLNPDTLNDPAKWTNVTGSLLISNQYKTVDFISDIPCDDGATNSCGEKIYCLPSLEDGDDTNDLPTETYDATRYRVIVKAAVLNDCSAGCNDPNFNECVTTPGGAGSSCQGETDTAPFVAFYPEAGGSPQGIIDLAFNSLNGNRDTYTFGGGETFGKSDGPGIVPGLAPARPNQSNQEPYYLNDEPAIVGFGDDLVWQFYVNRTVDLSQPNIIGIGPIVTGLGTNLILPVESTFDEVMFSSTLKSGSNYRDGLCGCSISEDCGGEDEVCEQNRCVNKISEQLFCLEDSECGDFVCHNKEYITLLDESIFNTAWWVSKENIDTSIPEDGYADQTMALINHTRFAEVTNYGTEIGSGVKDNYQNCFLPSEGPTTDSPKQCIDATGQVTGTCTVGDGDCGAGERCVSICTPGVDCCAVDISSPYCCNGEESDVECNIL